MSASQKRNLNPHKSAIMAMALYSVRYAAQNGGSMDFWDTLNDSEKETCRVLVLDVEAAMPEFKESVS